VDAVDEQSFPLQTFSPRCQSHPGDPATCIPHGFSDTINALPDLKNPLTARNKDRQTLGIVSPPQVAFPGAMTMNRINAASAGFRKRPCD
jgi:hypothetical protein